MPALFYPGQKDYLAVLNALNQAFLDYTPPTASDTVAGIVKVGTNLAIDGNGVLSVTETFVDTKISTAVDAHNAVLDPHPQYLTQAEADALYAAVQQALVDGDKGDITISSGGAIWTIGNGIVTYAKIQSVSATDKLLGRSSAGAGVVEEIPCTAFARSILDDTTAAAVRATIGAGTGGGSVTSVALSAPAFLTVSGSPITTAGTLALAYSGTALPILNGGTGGTTAASARTALGLGTVAILDSDTDTTLAANSDVKIATQKAVKTYVDSIVTSGASDVMIFKGVLDCSTNPNYPAAEAGNLYKVSVAGKIGGASGATVEVGDTVYCITDGTLTGTQAAVGASWAIVQVNVDGVVIGPTSATGNNVALFDGSTGKLIKDSGLTLSGSNTGDQTNIAGNAATVTTNANLTGPITSVGNATSVAAQTGTGSTFVMAASPTLTTPNLGTPSAIVLTNATGAPTWNQDTTGNAATATTAPSGVNTGDETTATIKTKLSITILSGDNTGDQTITLTSDVTGSGTGSFAATIANDAVTYAKMQNVTATDKLLGRSTEGSGDVEEIPCTAFARSILDDNDAASVRATIGAGAGTGDGTVTTVSVTTANGVSGSVATSTTTPAITLTLGDITPSSIASSGTVSGTNLSGTNTGDQTTVTGNAGTATALATARNIDGQSFNGTANITVIAPGTNAATSKATPVDGDELPLVDSAASNVLKKLTWANLKATLKTYFDTLYGTVAQPFDMMAFYPGVPTASAIVTRVPVAREITFPTSLTGSYVKASVAATAQTDFDVQLNAVSVATIRFAAAGTIATFIAASPIVTAAGDLLSIIAPASADATLANVGFVLTGTR